MTQSCFMSHFLAVLLFCAGTSWGQEMDLGALLNGLGGMQGGGGGRGGKGKPTPGANGCLPGKVPGPTAKPSYKYTANGCGPQGMQVKENFGLYVCCNNHDVCFGVCGTTFDFCENEFAKCMKTVCDKHGANKRECNEQAQSFSGMTRLFGGGMHQQSQVDACDCFDSQEAARQRHLEHITGLYERNNPEKAKDKAFVEGLLQRSKGKEGQLTVSVLQKYGVKEVVWDGVKGEL